jgi:outer membrane lipoprotein-sorting protein
MNLAREWIFCAVGLVIAGLLGPTLAYSQAGQQKPLLSEEAFKNVQVLRGIPAKEFMETMGFFAASLSMTCSDCHSEASGSNWANYADETPIKQTARRMVLMVNAINKANFGGTRSVTCYTCHRTSPRPKVIPSLAAQYAEPAEEDPDEVEPLVGARITVTSQQILDKYVQALGGAAAVAKLTSFTAKGTYVGFDSDFGEVPVDVYAKGPDMRAMVAHTLGGDSTTTYDGREGWAAGPTTLVPIPVLQLLGGGLLGARLDAQLTFPGQIKQLLTDWRAGFPAITIDGRPVDVIDGKTAGGVRVRLYFDKQSGLLVRQARNTDTAIGTITTHVVYSDYRAVAGVKIPYQWQTTWVDGQYTVKLTSVQPNAAIDATRFAKPSPPPPPR